MMYQNILKHRVARAETDDPLTVEVAVEAKANIDGKVVETDEQAEDCSTSLKVVCISVRGRPSRRLKIASLSE